MMPGFRGGSFRHIIAYHRRAQGTAAGMPCRRFEAGLTTYVIGSSPLFMVARAGRRMVGNPTLVVGVLLLAGLFGRLYARIAADGGFRAGEVDSSRTQTPATDDRTHVA
jgi:hypothetical protein